MMGREARPPFFPGLSALFPLPGRSPRPFPSTTELIDGVGRQRERDGKRGYTVLTTQEKIRS